jgi:hypothetical protein
MPSAWLMAPMKIRDIRALERHDGQLGIGIVVIDK